MKAVSQNLLANLARCEASFLGGYNPGSGGFDLIRDAENYLDELLDDWATISPQPDPATLLAFAKDVRGVELKISRDRKLKRGFSSGGVNYSLQPEDFMQLTALATAVSNGVVLPSPTRIRRRNGNWNTVTGPEIVTIHNDAVLALIAMNNDLRAAEVAARNAPDFDTLMTLPKSI